MGVRCSLCSTTGAFCFAFVLLFREAMSFDPISLLCFKRVLDSFAFYPLGTSIRARAFIVGICDFVTLFASTNACGN